MKYDVTDFMVERKLPRLITSSQPAQYERIREVEVGRRSQSSGIFAEVAPPKHAESEIGSMKLGASDWGELARSHQVTILIVAGVVTILAGAALALAFKAILMGLSVAGVGLLLIAIGVYPIMLWAVPVAALLVGSYVLYNSAWGAKIRKGFVENVKGAQDAKDAMIPPDKRAEFNRHMTLAQDGSTIELVKKVKAKGKL